MKDSVDEDGRKSPHPCIQSMDVFGLCNGLGRGDVALDMRIEVSVFIK